MADDRSEQVVHDRIDVCEDGEQGFRRCAAAGSPQKAR
jgi:hypothetical protein